MPEDDRTLRKRTFVDDTEFPKGIIPVPDDDLSDYDDNYSPPVTTKAFPRQAMPYVLSARKAVELSSLL